MRFLSFHVDYFWYSVTQKGRSEVREEITDDNRERRVENALVLFLSTEKKDETDPDVLGRAITEITKITNQLRIATIVINPFAHLFGELSTLEFALATMGNIAGQLEASGFSVVKIPFGWFNELEMKAKGHPLSRIARSF